MFKNKEGKIRSGWKIAGMMGATFAEIAIIGAILGIIFGILMIARNSSDGSLDLQNMNFTKSEDEIIKTISFFVQEIVMIITPIIAWRFIIKRPLSNMGLTPIKKHTKELLIGLLFGIVSISIVFAALLLSGSAKVETWSPHFSLEQLIYLVFYIMVGFAEEIFGRGYIMSALRQTRNVYTVVIISSVIFALLHSGNSGIGLIPYLNLTLVGVLFAFMYLRSGNLWMCIGYHITWNYFQGYVYGFKVSGNESDGIISTISNKNHIWNGGDFGPEGGLFVTFVILIGFLYVYYYYRASDYNFIASEDVPTIQKQPNQFSKNAKL